MFGEQRQHFLLALKILLLGVSQTVLFVYELVGGKADEPVVGGAVLLADEVYVVGGDDLHPVLFGEAENLFGVALLHLVGFEAEPRDLRFVKHDLEVIVLAEDFFVPLNGLGGSFFVAVEDMLRNFPDHARGRADEPFMIFFYDFVAHPRAVVHTFDVGLGDDFHQVLIAFVILGQKNQMIVFRVGLVLQVVVVASGYVYLAAYDGLYRGVFLGEFQEFLHPVHVSVVGYGKTAHAELLGSFEEIFYGRLAVQDGVLCMYVQVNEGHRGSGLDRQR